MSLNFHYFFIYEIACKNSKKNEIYLLYILIFLLSGFIFLKLKPKLLTNKQKI